MNQPITARQPTTSPRVRVWDLPVRLFHWLLLALIITLFVTAEVLDDAIELHARAGLAVLTLVMFRLSWGVVGSTYARFRQFLRGPGTVLSYARSLFHARPHFMAGHNPLGGWMVFAILLLILVQGGVGLFANDDILFEGPLAHLVSKETSDLLTGLHEDLFHALLVLVGLHVGALIWHKVFKRENLVPAMFTGYKEVPPGEDAEDTQGENVLLAAVLLIACAAVVYWIAG